MRARRTAALAALLLAVTACSSDSDEEPQGDPTTGSAAASSTSDPSPTPTDPTTPAQSSSQSSSQSSGPSGGTAADPAVLEPEVDLLGWEPVAGSVDDLVTTGGDWTLTVPRNRSQARLQGPDPVTVTAGKGRVINETLLDDEYAVVVAQDKAEERAAVATVVELATGRRTVLDERAAHPTVNGGTWALGEDASGATSLMHATRGADGTYCLARVDLASGESETAWCSPQRHGFTDARVTPAGTSLLTFDDSRPACFTVVELADQEVTPFADAPACTGWDGLLLTEGRVWSVVPKANQVETAQFFAESPAGHFDLGQGMSGSLTWCGDAAYFAQDPLRDGDPARLLRWDGTDLSIVYETPGQPGIISEPRCGGDRITLTALSEGGDEQVSAAVR